MSLNADLVRARCAEIEESVRRLEEFQRLPRDAFLANQDTLDIVSCRLLVAIETALAVCYHHGPASAEDPRGLRRVFRDTS